MLGLFKTNKPFPCVTCGYRDSFKGFSQWRRNGARGLRGKLPSGHIVIACPKCGTEMIWDSLSGRVDGIVEGNLENQLSGLLSELPVKEKPQSGEQQKGRKDSTHESKIRNDQGERKPQRSEINSTESTRRFIKQASILHNME